MQYMLVEKGYRYNRYGNHAETKGTGDLIPLGYEQVAQTNTYKTIAGAIRGRKAIMAKPDEWGDYEEGEIQIAEINIVA